MMELIHTISNEWYFWIDHSSVGFHESKLYKTESEALTAMINNEIEWDSVIEDEA